MADAECTQPARGRGSIVRAGGWVTYDSGSTYVNAPPGPGDPHSLVDVISAELFARLPSPGFKGSDVGINDGIPDSAFAPLSRLPRLRAWSSRARVSPIARRHASGGFDKSFGPDSLPLSPADGRRSDASSQASTEPPKLMLSDTQITDAWAVASEGPDQPLGARPQAFSRSLTPVWYT